MDTGIVTIAAAFITFLGTWITAKYRGIKRRDRTELLFERYDSDYQKLSERLTKIERELDTKNRQVADLQRQLNRSITKYNDLLKKFNKLKDKYEQDQEETNVI